MPSPNPQPRPQPARNPNPQSNPTVKKQARVSAATIKPRPQPKPRAESKPEKRPGSFRLLVGLIATLAGAWLLTIEDYEAGRFIKQVVPGAMTVAETGNIQSFQSPTAASVDRVTDFLANAAPYLPYLGVTLGLLLLLFGGLCLKGRTGIFLVTMVVLVTAALAVLESLSITPQLSWIVIGAAGVAYILQSGRERITAPPIGMLGYMLVFVSLMAVTRQWFNWPAIIEYASTRWDALGSADVTAFFNQWGELVTWCIVLALATLGASFSKGRLLHVLGATMLVILVISLFKNAYHELVHFPSLGPNVKPLDKYSLTNITPWQWMVLVEVGILCAILIYRGLGAGGLTIAVAAVWLLAGYQVDKTAGRMMMSREISQQMVNELNQPEYATDAAPAIGAAKRQVSPEEQTKMIVTATTPVVWFYLNTIFAGLIGLCGIRMMVGDASARWWINNFLWVAFALSVMWIYSNWPVDRYALALQSAGRPDEGFSIERLLGILSVHPIHQTIAATVALFMAAFAGTWALRWNSRYDTWLYVAATMVFLGTLASFGTLAIMIQYSFLEPLPIVSYIALAVAQSSLMWVLLLHVNFRDRHIEHRSRPTAPAHGPMPSLA